MSASDVQPPESYRKEEVQEILHLAIARKTESEELSRTQLWEIAAELEIDPESLQIAEQDWLSQKQRQQKRTEFEQYRREQLKQKTVKYLIINAFLLLLNFLAAGTLSWSLYLLLLLGLPLALDSWKTLQTEGQAYEKAFQQWYFKKEIEESISSVWNKIKKAWQS
ncbi:2TM domain-containing protein [Crocosphaera sp. UHCC 0190]|uniref:2TM domain-containing protein n=1 Tax=Crocosphaera sp. UHCC 0190 TaxID=3110246 RepID=UPI002B1F19FA|nr:2TM domain-containing protein [Crocosphaera sp. UHCC 0190]MEA5511684.1 2TM domain-containing protein [Crocosphaera sp. UHCC 0190]